jgi:hypothetical protein
MMNSRCFGREFENVCVLVSEPVRAGAMACSVHPFELVDSYISTELIAKLREDQRDLRKSIHALESAVKLANHQRLTSEFREFTSLYRSHERLVGALLEAVEVE